jgi:hypothetical protein
VLSVKRKYSAFLAASNATIYSISALNRATDVWRFNLQLINVPCNKNMWLLMDFRSAILPAQSKSV